MEGIETGLMTGLTAIMMASEEGSATRAAMRLGVTPATALRRIEAAEHILGVRLFERLPTGLVQTQALVALLPWVVQALAAARGMLDEVARVSSPGLSVVRVASAPVVSAHILAPAALMLQRAHPEIILELVGANAPVHMERLEADIAIRGFRPTQGDLVTRKLRDFNMVVAGSPSLQAVYASRGLSALPWLTWERGMQHLPEARWLEQVIPDARVMMRAAEFSTLIEAARTGLGAVLLPSPLAKTAGLDVLELAPPLAPQGALWLVAHNALRSVPRVTTVWEWLITHFDSFKS